MVSGTPACLGRRLRQMKGQARNHQSGKTLGGENRWTVSVHAARDDLMILKVVRMIWNRTAADSRGDCRLMTQPARDDAKTRRLSCMKLGQISEYAQYHVTLLRKNPIFLPHYLSNRPTPACRHRYSQPNQIVTRCPTRGMLLAIVSTRTPWGCSAVFYVCVREMNAYDQQFDSCHRQIRSRHRYA